jgi:hypothetical protein
MELLIIHNKLFRCQIIPYDLAAFKVLLRKIFPPKDTILTVDTNGDGKADSLQIKVINLIIPFVIPKEIEIGDFKLKDFNPNSFDISQFGKFLLDNRPLNFSKDSFNLDTIKNRLSIYHKGESFNIDDILEGKFSGRTIDLGDTASVLLKIDESSLEMFTEGKHSFKIESDLISNLEIFFELDENNMNIKFDPDNV